MVATGLLPDVFLVFMHLLPPCVQCDHSTTFPVLPTCWVLPNYTHLLSMKCTILCALGYSATYREMQVWSAIVLALWSYFCNFFAKNLFANCCFPCTSWSFSPSQDLLLETLEPDHSTHSSPFFCLKQVPDNSSYLHSLLPITLVNVMKPSQSTAHTRIKIKAKDLIFKRSKKKRSKFNLDLEFTTWTKDEEYGSLILIETMSETPG